jgi:putative membrane protein
MGTGTLLLALHVMANCVWIGAIASVGWLLAAAAKAGDRSSAVLARGLYRTIATPAFLVSFAAGLLRVLLDPSYYMHLHWFHGKVTFALVVIALHHVIGARAKRASDPAGESMQAGKSGGILAGALLAFAFLTVVFVIFKQALVP